MFLVVGNIAAHTGSVVGYDTADLWPNGPLTYQDMLGSFGTNLGEFENEEEAKERLRAFLICRSVETGTYCYNHNPDVR